MHPRQSILVSVALLSVGGARCAASSMLSSSSSSPPAALTVDVSDFTTPASSSSLTSPTGASTSSIAVKSALLQWDVQLKLSAAQQAALSAFQQRLATLRAPPHRSLPQLRPGEVVEVDVDDEEAEDERKRKHAEVDVRPLLLAGLAPSAAFPLSSSSPPSSFSHASHHAALLSSYLHSSSSSSSSSSSPFTSAYDLLSASSTQLHELLSLSSSLLSRVSVLYSHAALVTGRTTRVREECAALLREQRELLAKAQRYTDNLAFFSAAEQIQRQLQHTLTITSSNTSSTSLDAAHFPTLLSTIDRCTAYLHHNPNFQASALYLSKYERLKVVSAAAANHGHIRCPAPVNPQRLHFLLICLHCFLVCLPRVLR